MKRDDRAAAFRMLDEYAAKERSEALDVEFAKAALLDDSGTAPKPSRCCSWRSSAFPIIRACATRSR